MIILVQRKMPLDHTISDRVWLQCLGAQALKISIVICGMTSTSPYVKNNTCHFDHSIVICIIMLIQYPPSYWDSFDLSKGFRFVALLNTLIQSNTWSL